MITQTSTSNKNHKIEFCVHTKGNSTEFFSLRVYLEVTEEDDHRHLHLMNWVADVSYTCNGTTKDLGKTSDYVRLTSIRQEALPEWLDSQLEELGFQGTINYLELLRL